MKDPSDRTKVVVRRLPPSISQPVLMEQIDGRFAGRYDWVCFRQGKNSQKNQRYTRAYLNFKRLDDVVEFAEFFDGHIFVNEKGTQFKALVEYAPFQRVPKHWSKKDVREGTIYKDPEYMEFLELISKPVEHLPSAEIQLERKEAERAGAQKETPIVTPLMDFVRRKRAAKSGAQRSSGSGKVSRRVLGISASSSSPSKRSSEKRKYVLKDSMKKGSAKDKPTYILMPRREDQQLTVDKSISVPSPGKKEALEDEFASETSESGKGRFVLLKGNEQEVSDVSKSLLQQHIITSSVRNSQTSTSRQNQASGRIIRKILSKEGHADQSHVSVNHPEQQTQAVNVEKDKRLPRPPSAISNTKDYISRISSLASASDGDDKRYIDDKFAVNNIHGSISISEKHEKRTRKKDRPDRGVWAPRRRADRSRSGDGGPSAEVTQMTDALDSISISQQAVGKVGEEDMVVKNVRVGRGNNLHAAYEIGRVERKADMSSASRSEDMKMYGSGRVDFSSLDNGSHRHVGRLPTRDKYGFRSQAQRHESSSEWMYATMHYCRFVNCGNILVVGLILSVLDNHDLSLRWLKILLAWRRKQRPFSSILCRRATSLGIKCKE
ncbi:hypothetical protein OPV22_019633 [Ensete ventricosum]|uniref:UPF3 domain-containing protein n=1 Tax=Ensete ventricosum TaxID=4639 RepID=A0AAV8PBC9_ENSVE|nr:hypothetical protein OPV22_019633 [Ensete ventricosum]